MTIEHMDPRDALTDTTDWSQSASEERAPFPLKSRHLDTRTEDGQILEPFEIEPAVTELLGKDEGVPHLAVILHLREVATDAQPGIYEGLLPQVVRANSHVKTSALYRMEMDEDGAILLPACGLRLEKGRA